MICKHMVISRLAPETHFAEVLLEALLLVCAVVPSLSFTLAEVSVLSPAPR